MGTPVKELRLALMGENEVAKARTLLETKLHCTLTFMSLESYYLVRFPDGTVEGPCAEPDPRMRSETVITLPGGVTLRKVVRWPCVHAGCSHTYLLLPDDPDKVTGREKYAKRTAKPEAD